MESAPSPTVSEALAALLEHLDPLTGERQRPRLESLMVEAVAKIANAQRVSFSKLVQTRDETLCWLAVVTAGGQTRVLDDGVNAPPSLASLDSRPDILAAVLAAEPRQYPLADGGIRLVMVIGGPGSAAGYLEIELTSAPDRKCLMLVTTVVTVFRNVMGLLDYSEVDSLTGLLNRKTFDEHLMKIVGSLNCDDDSQLRAVQLPHRRRAAVSGNHWLAVLDIDHFKRINDNFGHLIGDEVLLLIANMMKNSFRFRDKLFRFGGEEFVVVLKPTTAKQAKAIFERFRRAIQAYPFPQVGQVTVSVGFAPIRLHDQPSVILDNADRALYWAKEHGRNQVAAFEELVADGRLEKPADLNSEIDFF